MNGHIMSQQQRYFSFFAAAIVIAIIAIAVTSSFFPRDNDASAAANGTMPPAPEVQVTLIELKKIRVWREFSGKLRAIHHVEVRPRVGGTITKVLFEEGSIVQEGTPLFVIDPRPYEAAKDSVYAALQAAQSELKLAQTELDRATSLLEKKIIAKSRYDEVFNRHKVAQASLNAAKAAYRNAKLDVEYAHIKAPVTGRVSRAEITEGNVIEAGNNAPILTTIVSNDKLYAEFDVDEQTYLQAVRHMRNAPMPVEMQLASDENLTYEGKIHSFDNRLDATSGTIRARAVFENTDGLLVPGMYAHVRLGSAQQEPKILLQEHAIGTDQNKKFVYVIGEDNTIQYREVKLGHPIEGKRIISAGLDAGEKVLINGLQRVRPGMQVQPVLQHTNDGDRPDRTNLEPTSPTE
jgi:multidrug efflux system membrane fusion protein